MLEDFELPLWYDQKKYHVLIEGNDLIYPIGGLACEYSRFKPTS